MSAANNCAMNGLGMDFYLAVDDNGQTDEERSVVSNVLKGYQSTAFVPVQQLEWQPWVVLVPAVGIQPMWPQVDTINCRIL